MQQQSTAIIKLSVGMFWFSLEDWNGSIKKVSNIQFNNSRIKCILWQVVLVSLWSNVNVVFHTPRYYSSRLAFGGMENPCLTFVTPTLLTGDKSNANVIAHEISHSWTGCPFVFDYVCYYLINTA